MEAPKGRPVRPLGPVVKGTEKNPGKVSDRVKPYLVKDLFFNSKERKFLVKQSCKKKIIIRCEMSADRFLIIQ